MWEDFKKFAFKGNILDLALAVVIGGAFQKIVSSLVNDMIMPLIGVLLGGINFSKLSFRFGKAVIQYGSFIQTIVDFFIIAITLFLIVRVFLKFKKNDATSPSESQAPSNQELLLTDIRDLLRESIEGSNGQTSSIRNQGED